MVSDNDRKILDYITTSVNVIRSKIGKTKFLNIYEEVSAIIKSSEKLENVSLGKTIKAEATKIMQTSNVDEIIEYLDNISAYISKEENEAEKIKTYLDVSDTKQNHRFLSDLQSYASYSKNIQELQGKILASPVYQENLHWVIKHGKWRGYMHAHLTKNLRLMYLYDDKKKLIIWEAIVQHKEIDIKK